MFSLNKFETIGILSSIGVMSLALMLIQYQPAPVAESESDKQSAVAVVSQEEESESKGLEEALYDAHSANGELIDLVVEDVRIGEGDIVNSGDTLVVHYIGSTQDGVKFDSSYERGNPFVFTIGKGVVIKGWDEGLIGMKVGGQRVLVIPSDMAYGNRQVGTIPPNTPLVFAVELLEIR